MLRIGPIYGPGMDRNLSIWKMLNRIWNNKTVEINNPKNVLSLISSRDAALAIANSIDGEAGLYNITGVKLTIEDFLKHIAVIYNKKNSIFLHTGCVKNSDINLNFDLSHAETGIKWKPSIIDRDTVLEMANEFNNENV